MEILTREEHDRLSAELRRLTENRPVISQRIAEARELGDLKENAEYHAAREQQGLEEAEIRRLEARLATAQVVDRVPGAEVGIVFLGATVRLRDLDDDDEETFTLVGEATNQAGGEHVEVTVSSPMGEALYKARIGETIRVKTRRGIKRFEVVEII